MKLVILSKARSTLLLALCIGAGIVGAVEIRYVTDARVLQGSPIREHETYAALAPELQRFPALVLLADGTRGERTGKVFGAQFALTPTAIVSRFFPPPVPFYRNFLDGPPILFHVADHVTRSRVVDVLEYVAKQKDLTIQLRELPGGLLLVQWERL